MLAGFCNQCGKKMKRVLQFNKDGQFVYYLCQDCNNKTAPKKLQYINEGEDKE